MLAEFRGALLKSPGEPAASGIWSKTERGKRKEKEKLKACSPRRKAHSGGGISAHRRTVPEDTWLLAPRSLGASSSSSAEPGTPPESLLHQTDHMNFKMVPGSRGQERVDRSRRWGVLSDAHTAGRRGTRQRWKEKWNAAPLRGLHGAPGPGTSLPPPIRCGRPFLGENYPQTLSPEASLPPGPPFPAAGPQLLLTPLSAASSQLSATSSSSILLAAFPPPPTPPRACALKRAWVAGGGTQGFPQWTTPPHPARKRLWARP